MRYLGGGVRHQGNGAQDPAPLTVESRPLYEASTSEDGSESEQEMYDADVHMPAPGPSNLHPGCESEDDGSDSEEDDELLDYDYIREASASDTEDTLESSEGVTGDEDSLSEGFSSL